MKFENLFFAHRGVHDNIRIPENSIIAFKEALNNKLNIELDVQLTKDNILIVFHDNNLKRMTGIDKNINELTYNELRNLKLLNTNEHIPTFKDVLELKGNSAKLIPRRPFEKTGIYSKYWLLGTHYKLNKTELICKFGHDFDWYYDNKQYLLSDDNFSNTVLFVRSRVRGVMVIYPWRVASVSRVLSLRSTHTDLPRAWYISLSIASKSSE
jgi:hypothetical protein